MTMRAQPEGLHRKRRGEVKTNPETGKPVPADEYDILIKDGTVIGTTKRHYKGLGWFALNLAGGSLKTAESGLPEPYRTHGDAMAAIGAEYAETALTPEPPEAPVPELVRSESPLVVEEERITVIEVSPQDIIDPDALPPEEYPQESSVADPVGTMPGEELLDSLPKPDKPKAAPEQAQEAQMAETDDWLRGEDDPPADSSSDFFDDPFAPVSTDGS